MNPDDEDLERRLRSALTTPRSADRVDTEDFLSSVHRGARVRRVKRGVSVGVAGVLVVAGGGLAINAAGLLGGSKAPIANGPTHVTTPDSTGPGTPTRSSTLKTTPSNKPDLGPVQISAHSFIASGDVHAVSLTATGTEHQWVLAATPGRDCGRPSCATVLSTDKHADAGTWKDVGQLPAPIATSDNPSSTTVSQLRFAQHDTTTYDGWAYGQALWSTHDSGSTWSAAKSPQGQVTQLEAWGQFVYAGVSSPVPGDDTAMLYRSPTHTDDWKAVSVGHALTSVLSLAAAKGVVGLIDQHGLHSTLYISRDGANWEPQTACPAGTEPQSLSTATDAATGLGSLWVTCTNTTSTQIYYMDTDTWGTWNGVKGTFGRGVMVAARTPLEALVAGGGVPGIERVSGFKNPQPLPTGDVGTPVYFAFTNDRYGYLINSDGAIISTKTRGAKWKPYLVSDTTP